MLKPAKAGRGIVAGGSVRSVVELAGIRDIVSKSMGSPDKLSVARATLAALEKVKVISSRENNMQIHDLKVKSHKKNGALDGGKKGTYSGRE